jgi:molybdopterin-biosynthesis enzyme MoeA-like protein
MAGVPSIMRAMLEGVKGNLVGGAKVLSRTVLCTLGEGTVADGLAAIQKAHPDIDIGSYPQYSRGEFRVSLVVRGTDAAALDGCRDEIMSLISSLGGVPQILNAEEEAANG